MQPVPLIHLSALPPAIGILNEIGAPTEALLQRSHLPTLDYENPSGFVPVLSTWSFIDDAAETQGLWDFGFRIAERVTVLHWTGLFPSEYRSDLMAS
jgi:hypothetical protein